MLRPFTCLSKFFLIGIVCLFFNFKANAAIWYVATASVGLGNGTSWSNATNDLQLAINSSAAGDQIWVAAGVYLPNRRADALGTITLLDRHNSFGLKDSVAIYGGFIGGETALSQRNYTANVTTLSGDFANNDIVTGTGSTLTFSNNTENAYHVVVSVSDGTTTILDGFTISGGSGNGASTNTISVESIDYQADEGGGICIHLSFMQITNCVIKNNYGLNYGGGVYLGTSSGPSITNCIIDNNGVGAGGNAAGMFCFQSTNPIVRNCAFIGNRAGSLGGAIHVMSASSPTIINCVINGNASTGPVISNSGSTGLIQNTVIWGNSSPTVGSAFTINHSLIEGGYTGTGNVNANPLFVNAADPDGIDNVWGNSDDGLLFNCYSPAVNSGTTGAFVPLTDVRGIVRPQYGAVDMGPYEDVTNLAPVVVIGGTTTACNSLSLSATGASSYTWSGGSTPTASVNTFSASGVYTITGISVPGCTNVTTSTVTINASPTITVNISNPVICMNGTTNLQAGGATTYTWSGGITNGVSFSPTTTASYTVTGTDGNTCTNTAVTTVTVNSLPVVTASASVPSICMNGTTSLHGSGASTYTWSGGITNGASFSPTTTASYTVTGTDGNTCTNTAVTTVTVRTLPVVTGSASVPSICMNGTTSLHGGGAGTYTWTGGVTNAAVFSPTTTTNYTVTGTGSNSCTNTAVTTVTVRTLPVVTGSASVPSICMNGTTSLHGSGASTYTWTGGVTNAAAFSPTTTTNYTVTGTGSNSCTNTAVTTVTVRTLPVVTGSASVPSICMNGTTSLHGSGASTYTWTGGVTNAAAFSPTTTTNYTVTGTGSNACTNTAVTTVTVRTLPVVTAGASVPATCLNSTTSLHGGGASSYTWSNGVPNATAFSPTITATYTVTGTGTNACTNTAAITVTVKPLPTVTASVSVPVICASGTTTVHGGGASTYTWSNGVPDATSFSLSTTSNLTVTGTGSNACTNTAVVSVSVNPLPAVTASVSVPVICMNGTTSLHGGGAITYSWSGGAINGAVFSPTTTTSYIVTGTDANGCSNMALGTVSVVALPVVTASASSPAICLHGSVTLNGGGASTYTWTGGVINGASFIPTTTNTYTVTGSIGSGCTNTAAITVTVNPLPNVVASANPSNVICVGQTVTLNGGGASTYTWSSLVLNGVPFTPLLSDSYIVTGEDQNGCQNSATVSLIVNPLPTVTATASSSQICIGSTVTLTGSGATTYTWSGGVSNGVAFSPTATASYSLNGTTANCTSTNPAVISVTVNALPQLTVNSGSVCLGNSFQIIPQGAVSYTYVNGGPNVTPVSTTNYSILGTDQNGCINNPPAQSTVFVNNLPIINLAASQTTLCSGSNLTLTASGANTYTWSNGDNTSEINLSPQASTVYSVTGTDANSCSAGAFVSIIVLPVPNLVISPANLRLCIGSSITISALGADSILWNSGETTPTITINPTVTTSYTVIATHDNLCSVSKVITVTVNPLPTVDLGPDIEVSAGTPYQFNVNQTGAVSYTWSGGEGLSSTTVLNPELILNEERSFTLTVTSSRGCKASDDILVKVMDNLVIANYMSPNGDGKNDTWKLSSVHAIKDCSVEIIDGWGKSVYKKESGYNNDFDAANLPDGVYYYFIVKDGTLKYKGSITVTR